MPHGRSGADLIKYEKAVDWKRVRDTFTPDKGYSLWGDNDASLKDIRQGAIGDCWFLAAASALAEKPDRIKKIFREE